VFGEAIQFIANPNLFATVEEARAALASWPLGEPNILNAPTKLARLANKLGGLTVEEAADLSRMLREKWKV
jgi:hypothetical protein